MIGQAAGLFPRRFLFAAVDFQPERAAGKTRRIEIALRADALEVQHGAHAVVVSFDVTVPESATGLLRWLEPGSRAERGGRRQNPMFRGACRETLQPEAVLIGRRPQ